MFCLPLFQLPHTEQTTMKLKKYTDIENKLKKNVVGVVCVVWEGTMADGRVLHAL